MTEDKDESLIAHLEELRSTLLKCFYAIGIILPFAFWLSPKALDFLVQTLIGKSNITLNYFSPMEVFILQIKLALLIDIIICFPYISKKIWDFILPALYEKEKTFIKTIVITSSILFAIGVTFCLFMILPLIINFGISFTGNNINAVFGISNIINLSLWMSFTFGLMFQVPLIVNLLIRWDIISHQAVSSKRPYIIVVLLIFAAILTPPDIISQILLFIPTYLLFELGLLFSGNKNKQKEITNNDKEYKIETIDK